MRNDADAELPHQVYTCVYGIALRSRSNYVRLNHCNCNYVDLMNIMNQRYNVEIATQWEKACVNRMCKQTRLKCQSEIWGIVKKHDIGHNHWQINIKTLDWFYDFLTTLFALRIVSVVSRRIFLSSELTKWWSWEQRCLRNISKWCKRQRRMYPLMTFSECVIFSVKKLVCKCTRKNTPAYLSTTMYEKWSPFLSLELKKWI